MTEHRPFAVRARGVFGAPDATVVRVDKGRIAAVGGPDVVREGDEVSGAGTGWLLPGLVDAHVHLGPGTARGAAVHGVTTVVDQFSTPDLVADEAERVARPGAGACATALVAGVGATAPGGHPTMAYSPIPYVRGPHEAREFVAARRAEGSTHLKVIYDDGMGAEMDLSTLSAETIRALVAAAHAEDMVVVAHVSTAEGAVLVARCGVDVLGHVPFEPLATAQVREVADLGVAVVATLSIVDGFPLPDGRLPLEADAVLSGRLTPAWSRVLRAQAQRWLPPGGLDIDAARRNVAALHAAGVRVLAGTDAPNPGLVVGLSLHRELAQLVRAGLTPSEAIAAATSLPSDVFGLPDRGRIQVGARADLVLVSGDPTTDITATGRIEQVWVAAEQLAPAAGDEEAQQAQIDWIRRTNDKIVAAVEELWPQWTPARRPEIVQLTGAAEVDEILPALTHPDKDVRQRGAVAVGTLGHPAAAAALVARLRDEPDFFVRETITWAVTRLAEVTRAPVEALTDSSDPEVVTQALHALSKIASPLSLPVLERHTGHPNGHVAAKARAAIARIGVADGIPMLTRHLGQGDESTQNQLTADLASFAATAAPALADALVTRLTDAAAAVRRHSADVLTHIGPPAEPATTPLTGLLHDPDDDVRLAAAMALYDVGGNGRAALTGYDGDDGRLLALARRAAHT